MFYGPLRLRKRVSVRLVLPEKKFLFFFFDKCFSFAEMTTKFNQELYAKMRAKNEPLSNLEKRVVQVIEKGTPVTPVAFVPKAIRVASPATSVEKSPLV